MKLLQAEEIETQRQMKKIEVNNPEVLTDIKEYKGQSDLLTANLVVIDNAIVAQANIAEDSVATVDVLLRAAIDSVINLNVRATTMANTVGDKELVKLLDKPVTFYHANTKEICIQKLDSAVTLLEDRHAILTNIEPADITAVKAKINLYRTNKDAPRAEIVAKKADGTDVLSVAVAKGKKIKELMIKLIMGQYKVTNPTLANKASLLGKPTELGKRHNTGTYSVVNLTTEEPVLNAVITEVKTSVKKKKVKTKVYQVDGDGKVIFNKHILGKVVLTVVATGFEKQTVTVTFKKNDPNEFVVGLTRVIPK